MENQYLTLDELEVGKSYWVVNGCWEFKVVFNDKIEVGIYCPAIDRHLSFFKHERNLNQIIEKK